MKADFYMGDLYPNLAFFNTRSGTIPESQDQQSLVDDQELSAENPVDVSPEKSRSILWSIGLIFLVVVLLGVRF